MEGSTPVAKIPLAASPRASDIMSEQLPRSPYDMVGGLVYFPRMFDKIRLHGRGDLPEAYHNNLGRELEVGS